MLDFLTATMFYYLGQLQNVLSEENFTWRGILECSLNFSVCHSSSCRNYVIIARKLCTFINIQINSVHVYVTLYKTYQESHKGNYK